MESIPQNRNKGHGRKIIVFHDESGDYGCSNWVFTGLLWFAAEDLISVHQDLQVIRTANDYWGEIHFKRLPQRFDGEFSAKARVARQWFDLWENHWMRQSWFNVLAVHLKHRCYDQSHFLKNFHAYNRFTAIALKGGLAWHFPAAHPIELSICSDEKIRRPYGLLGDGVNTDNFEQYVMKRLQDDVNAYRGPKVVLIEPIRCIDVPGKGPYTSDEEMIQLCDLLLGSVAAAIEAKSAKETKRAFGRRMAALIVDSRLEPQSQQYGLHRRFSVSYFPNEWGEIYSHGPIKIVEIKQQLSLF